jgi:hypothetical protein
MKPKGNILAPACLFHSFNTMRDRSERLRAPWPSIDHVQVLLLSSSGERQHRHQLDTFSASPDQETSQENDEPSGLQAGESTTHSEASFAIDDVSSFLPSFLFSSLPSFYFHCVPDAAFNPATTH